jgi:hypothetical protein
VTRGGWGIFKICSKALPFLPASLFCSNYYFFALPAAFLGAVFFFGVGLVASNPSTVFSKGRGIAKGGVLGLCGLFFGGTVSSGGANSTPMI